MQPIHIWYHSKAYENTSGVSVAIFGIRPLAGEMGLNVQIFGVFGRSDPAPLGAIYLRPGVEFQKSLRTELQNDTKYALVGSLMLAVGGGR